MHSYAVDSSERTYMPFYLAVSATSLTLSLRFVWTRLGLAPFIAVPSGFALYGILFLLFDQLVWRWKPLHQLRLVRVPALQGTWEGELLSSASEYLKPHPVKLRIHQTWSTIQITLDSETSFSSSHMAWIRTISPMQYELRWEYLAEAKNPAQGLRFNHRGVTMLRFEAQDGLVVPEMKGDYYTQHGRDTNGIISVKMATK